MPCLCDFWEINFTHARAPWPSLPALQPAVWNKEAPVCPWLRYCVRAPGFCGDAGLCQLHISLISCSRMGQVLPAGHWWGAGRQEEGEDVFACCSCLCCSSNTSAKPGQLLQSPLLLATSEAALGHPPGVPAQRSKPSSMGMRLKF